MVSAPATYWMSRHPSPASSSAASAATTPYSTKLRPHLPHGCIPTPSTATSLMTALRAFALWSPLPAIPRFPPLGRGARAARCDRGSCHDPPLPDQVLVLVILVQRAEHEFD